jgi:hypothetical protein
MLAILKNPSLCSARSLLARRNCLDGGVDVVTPRWACGPTLSRITERMKKISYSGYRFPPEIIHQAIWLYSCSPSGCAWRSMKLRHFRPPENHVDCADFLVELRGFEPETLPGAGIRRA